MSLKLKHYIGAALGSMLLAAGLLGCVGQNAQTPVLPDKLVKTVTVHSETRPEPMMYIGTVDAEKTVALSFKNGGTLLTVPVEKGDPVTPGMLLAQQEGDDYQLAYAAISAQTAAQEALVLKAEDALTFTEKQFARIDVLHDAQALSDSEHDEAYMALQHRRQEVQAARQALAQLRAQSGLTANALENTRLVSPVAGYVMEAPFEAGEIVGDGVPVVILRSEQQLVRIGVSQKDLPRITLGMSAQITVDDTPDQGVVTNIAQVPNPDTRTYLVEIRTAGSTYPVGAIARVKLQGPDRQGVLIPIECIQASTVSYVYIVVDGLAVKKEVELQEAVGPYAFVNGIASGDIVIVEGMKRIQPGDRVRTVKGGD